MAGAQKWIGITVGAPVAGDFNFTGGQGSPIVIDNASGTAYFVNLSGAVTALTAAASVPDPIVPADGTQNITGNLVTSGTLAGSNLSGTNTGDQTSIVGITGSLAEFNAALTGADFATGGGTVTGASSGTNTGDQTSIVGISGTMAQFNTACSDGDFQFTDAQLTSLAGLSYAGNAGKYIRVDAGETGFELNAIAGGGDVVGPAGATDNRIARFDGATGKLIQNSAATVDDDGRVTNLINSGACEGVGLFESWIKQAADRNLTNTVNEQKVFDQVANGTLTLPTGTYFFRCILYLTTMSGTSGNLAFDPIGAGTAVGATFLWGAVGLDNSTPTTAAAGGFSINPTQQSTGNIITAATGTAMGAIVEGTFRITTAGTIIPSISLTTAAAAVLKAGTFFGICRLAEQNVHSVGAWT